jgi:hypothetical protein
MICAENNDDLTVWFVNNDRCGVALSRLFRCAEISILLPDDGTVCL